VDFGPDGYFFVYDLRGQSLMHARQPEIVGHDLWNLKDPRGKPIIQLLTAQARAGGGFLEYEWQRPSDQRVGRKLGYVVPLERWGWMPGSGIYLEDIGKISAQIRKQASRAIRWTMLLIAGIAGLGTVLVAGSGLALNVSQQRIADGRLRALTWQVVSAGEAERTRVSRELHDGVMQLLVSVRYVFESALVRLNGDRSTVARTLEDGIERLNQVLEEVRRISHDLRPLARDGGLPGLLRQLGHDSGERTGTVVRVDAEGPLALLPDETAMALFRVAQEAMSNVERHARARRITIALVGGAASTMLTVSDDGCGFDTAAVERQPRAGIGISNMRERVEALGGRFSIRSGSAGTIVEAEVPGRSVVT
jgi:two-component system NarL family sensor kinase